MMFGMTGAGKSALGNLIAGQNIFDSGALIPRALPFQGTISAFSLLYAERFFMFPLCKNCRTVFQCGCNLPLNPLRGWYRQRHLAKQRLFFGASSEAAFYDTSEVTNLDSIKRPTNSSRFCFFFQEKDEWTSEDWFFFGGADLYG